MNANNEIPPTEIQTPRFGTVTVTKRFGNTYDAALAGFTEPTGRPDIKGKVLDQKSDKYGHGWVKYEWASVWGDY